MVEERYQHGKREKSFYISHHGGVNISMYITCEEKCLDLNCVSTCQFCLLFCSDKSHFVVIAIIFSYSVSVSAWLLSVLFVKM